MIKKLQKNDYIFIAALLVGLLLHVLVLYTLNAYEDETFYTSTAIRFINGDSLVQHDWHLTQFSSLFLYLPMRIWLVLKGSTDGIILFLRYLYLTIHTLTAVGIYTYFRKYGIWGIAAAMLFYTQAPYRMMAISYNSMFALFLLFFVFFLLLIYQKGSSAFYIFAGVCFGACCVCNPFFCTAFVLYIALCIIWRKKEFLQSITVNLKRKIIDISSKTDPKKYTKVDKKKTEEVLYIETYSCFFSKNAILFFSCGISIVAVISIIYFFATGGTISSIFANINNLLASSEYGIFSSSLADKLKETGKVFNEISFNMPFLLPLLYVTLFFDKKRKINTHRIVYLLFSFAIAILYSFGAIYASLNSSKAFALSLPFIVVSTVCYILTENKNKELFYCTWCPCAIGAIAHYFASNTHLTSIFMVLVISNIAGVFFVRDLFRELQFYKKTNKKNSKLNVSKKTYGNLKKENSLIDVCRNIICIGLCLQLLFQCYAYQYERVPKEDYTQVTTGPYAGFYMNEKHYNNYVNSINDLNVIKERSEKDDPVLIVSCHHWMYLYIDRPFAVNTTWQATFEPQNLELYYKANPERIPKYIYVGFADFGYIEYRDEAQGKAAVMSEMFDCTQEELSAGILLTVNGKNENYIY